MPTCAETNTCKGFVRLFSAQAVQIFWIVYAALEDSSPKRPKASATVHKRCSRLLLRLEQCVVYSADFDPNERARPKESARRTQRSKRLSWHTEWRVGWCACMFYRCAHARMPCVPSRLFFAAKLGGAISCRPLNSTATLSSTTQVLNVDRTMPAPSRSESQMPRGNPNYSLTASSIEFELRVSAKDTGVKIGSETVSASGDVASVSDGVCPIRNPSPCQCILAFPAA